MTEHKMPQKVCNRRLIHLLKKVGARQADRDGSKVRRIKATETTSPETDPPQIIAASLGPGYRRTPMNAKPREDYQQRDSKVTVVDQILEDKERVQPPSAMSVVVDVNRKYGKDGNTSPDINAD
jgi:hypothetical protein